MGRSAEGRQTSYRISSSQSCKVADADGIEPPTSLHSAVAFVNTRLRTILRAPLTSRLYRSSFAKPLIRSSSKAGQRRTTVKSFTGELQKPGHPKQVTVRAVAIFEQM